MATYRMSARMCVHVCVCMCVCGGLQMTPVTTTKVANASTTSCSYQQYPTMTEQGERLPPMLPLLLCLVHRPADDSDQKTSSRSSGCSISRSRLAVVAEEEDVVVGGRTETDHMNDHSKQFALPDV